MTSSNDRFSAYATLETAHGKLGYYRLDALRGAGVDLERLPFTIRILLESLLRNCDGFAVTEDDVRRLATWNAKAPEQTELPFVPSRVILQDFTGVPVLVDIAAMRAAVARLGGDPKQINPLVPVDLVIDHSVQVDHFGSAASLSLNAHIEFARNRERYAFLRWGQNAVDGFRAVPPANGIVHQVNLEFLAQGVLINSKKGHDGVPLAYPDTVVGTDSHTTMINGLGVLGWGVGGIEAEAVMLGQPLFMLTPQVIGCRLHGRLPEGVTATDLTLTITQLLRKKGVVDKFVEFYGPGLSNMSLSDRATIANMAPEYGATCGFFPFDEVTLGYLRTTNRLPEVIDRCERYYKAQGLFHTAESPEPIFTDTVDLDLSTVEPSMAGPKRPQDRVSLGGMKSAFRKAFSAPVKDQGFALPATELGRTATVELDGKPAQFGQGAVVIAAITSCTNTSNPSVLVAAGLVAKKAVEAGLHVAPHVKTSLAPGSKVVTEYLTASGLLPYLEQLGFYVVGYGCTTCIGNSGPLSEVIDQAIAQNQLVASAVLSGNRNFEGRIHPSIKANYLASPPLVVAYALAGTVDRDLTTEPLGTGKDGRPVFLRDLWPTQAEVTAIIGETINPAMFGKVYGKVFEGGPEWDAVSGRVTDLYAFDESSTYIQEPPFFSTMGLLPDPIRPITGARVLALLGDSVTTDHISPAGDIPEKGPAGEYLRAHGVTKVDFNSFGARRGNDRVMVRGTFANIRLKNLLVPGVEGGVTIYLPTGERMSIFDAAQLYQKDQTPLVIIAGKEYGTGSSRDWAAKGTLLLGVRAVIAESFERIHRSNLVGMGVLPLVFEPGQTAETVGLTGRERLSILVPTEVKPRQSIQVEAIREDDTRLVFTVRSRLDTPIDVSYYHNGGILQTVLRELIRSGAKA